MYSGPQASNEVRSGSPLEFWWLLALCLLLVVAGGASAAFAAVAAVSNSDPVAKDNGYRVKAGRTLERSAPAVLRNDSDPDGDKLYAVRASAPRHGKLILRRNGSFVYTPNKHFHGKDSFTYTARDGKGGTDTASVKIVVWSVSRPPLARNDGYRVSEDRILTRSAPGVLRNDAELNGRRLFATKVTDPKHGKLVLKRDGSFVYTPKGDFNGEDSFIYRAADRTGHGDKGTVTIRVGAVNDAPSFTKGSNHSADEDAGAQSVFPWATGISAGPADESGQHLHFEVSQNSNPGLFAAGPAISRNGTLTYKPADDENGQATIKVRLKDDAGTASGGDDTSDDQQLGITVNPVNDAPSVSVANNGPVNEGGSATITATAADKEKDPLSYAFDCDDNGVFETGPQPGNTTTCAFDESGERTVNARVTDGSGGADTGSTKVRVANVAPTADFGNGGPVNEGSPATVSFTNQNDVSTVDENAGFRYEYRCDGSAFPGAPNYATASTEDSTTCTFGDNGSRTVRGRIIDEDGGARGYTTSVTVLNVKPSITLTGPSTAEEGETKDYSFTVTDPGIDDTHTATTACGTGQKVSVAYDAATRQGDLECKFPDGPSTTDVTATVTDSDGASDTDNQKVTVVTANEAPTVELSGLDAADEGDKKSYTYTVTDPGTDPSPTITTSCGTGVTKSNETSGGFDCTFPDGPDNPTVSVSADDGDPSSNTGSDSIDVTVSNVAPAVVLSGPDAADEGDKKSYTYTVTDPGTDPSPTITTSCGTGVTKSNETSGGFDCTFPDGPDNPTVSVSADDGDPSSNTGSDTQNVTVANLVPTADDQSVTTDEDVAKTITLTGSDPAGAADPLSFKVTSLPDDGTLYEGNGTNAADEVQPSDLPRTLAGNQVTYEPDANSNGSDALDFRVNDGDANSAGATVSIQVNAINDAPTVGTEAGSASFTEGQTSPTQIDTGITVADVDDANLESATVKITSGHQSSDVLDVPSPPSGFTVNHTAGSDTLTITGAKTVAEYESLLRTVTFGTPSASPGTSRTITFRVNDGDANNPATNDTRDITITNVNDAPVISNVSGTVAYAENDPASQLDNDAVVSDNDSPNLTGGTVKIADNKFSAQDELTFTDQGPVTGTYNDTSGVLTISGTGTLAQYQAFIRGVGFRTIDETPETHDRTIELQVSDGEPSNGDSNVATKTVTVTETNDQPVVDTTDGASSYVEDASATVVDDGVTVTDVDDTNLASASVVISNDQTGDVLDFTDTAEIDGTYSTGTLTLLPKPGQTPDVADFQAALRSVTYSSTSQNPSETPRTINFSVNDGDDNSNSGSKMMNVVGVNDAPVLNTTSSALAYTENDPATAIDNGLTLDDVDSTNMSGATVRITSGYTGGEDVLSFTNQNGITGNVSGDTLTLSGSSSVDNYRAALGSVKYNNTSENPSATQRVVTFRADDGGAANNFSNTPTRSIDVKPVNDAPTADDETFNGMSRAVGNTSLVINETTDTAPDPTGPQKTVNGDILDGDTDIDGPGPLAVVSETNKATNDGGTVTIESDGDFTFHPKAGTSCTDHSDFFDYTVTDSDPTDPKTDTGRVTIDIQDCVWYVDDSAQGGGDGRSHSPYNVLDSIDGAGGAGDRDSSGDKIFLYDGTYSGGLPLENNQSLFTEKHGLVVGDGGAGNLTLEPNDGTGSTLNGGLVAASGNNVQGLNLGTTTGTSSVYALSGTSVGTFTMNNVTGGDLNNPAGGAINIAGTGNALNVQFGTLSSSGSSGNAVSIAGASGTVSGQSGTLSNATGTTVNLNGGSLDFTYGGSVSDDAGQLISISNKTSGTTDFNGSVDDVTATPNNGGGISLQSNGTALTRFDGGVNLSTGSANAISASNGGTLAIPDPAGTATNSIVSTTGTPLNVASTTIHGDDLVFEKISSNGSTNGIVLNNTGTSGNLSVTGNVGVCTIATPTCSGGTIQSTTGDGISLTNTSSPSFNLLRVLNTAGHGISGTTTSGLSLSNSLIQGAGDADNEAGLFFASVDGTNLTGNSSITNTVVNAPADVGAFIQNYGGTLNLTVSGSTFSETSNPVDQPGDDLLRMISDRTNSGSATITAKITGSTFKDSGSDDILANAQSSTGSGGGTMNLTVDGNTFDGNGVFETCETQGCNSYGIVTQGTQGATIRYTIQNNSIVNHLDAGIAARSDNSSNVQGFIKNNTIGTAGSPRSGSYRDRGIFLASDDSSDFIASVENNVIHSTFFEGISASTTDGTGLSPKMDVTILGNTTPTPADTSGPYLPSINMTASGNASACARAENNTAQAGRQSTNVGGAGSIDFLLFRGTATSTATFQLQGLLTPTDDASDFVKGKNPASADPVYAFASKDGSNPSTPQFTGGTCRTPVATPTP